MFWKETLVGVCCTVLADCSDPPPRLFARLIELIERLGHEENVLEVVDLEVLVENGVQ